MQPGKHEGPRRLLCDNESFMGGKDCKKEYKKKKIQLLNIPARSPEFNPIESFWGWLRQAMRRRDLEDLRSFRKDRLDGQTQEVAQNSEGADCRQAEVSEL